MILRYLDKDTLERRRVVLACKFWEKALDVEGTAVMVKEVLADWGIEVTQIDMECTDNASVMISCIDNHFKGWKRLACNPHTQQLSVNDVLVGSYTKECVPVESGAQTESFKRQVWAGKGPEEVALLFRRVRY